MSEVAQFSVSLDSLSALQIGPAARNLFGGREAAQRICRAVIKQ
jgi:hypothetical protein